MSKTALTNNVALASGDRIKLKHWTQAIRDLYAELLELKSGVVPEYHASPTRQYGIGDTFRYGHLRLLDKLLYQFKQNEDETWWTPSDNMPEYDGYKWNAVTWHSGLFVAVGSHGRIVTSRDGKKWDVVHWTQSNWWSSTNENVPSSFEFFDVKWCGDMFIAVGSYNSFVYSYDGTYWHVPMYVGGIYDNDGVFRNMNLANLTVRPTEFRDTDAWKGVAYDELTGFVFLCGTQSRTIVCRHVPTETVSTILFGETVFHVDDAAECNTHVFNSIESKKLDNETTSFVACGNWNEIVQCTVRAGTTDLDAIQWDREDRSSLIVEDNIHTISPHTISEDTGWNNISVRTGTDGKDYFVAIGSSGQAVVSLTGIGDSWSVPVYEDLSIRTNFRCQAQGWNLTVVAGDWIEAAKPNITMYNDSVYTETENMEYGSSIPIIQHFSTSVDMASWYGAAFGNEVFVLVGDKNRIYWHQVAEEDYSGSALSIEFYKRYLADLERRVIALESQLLVSDMVFVELENVTKTFMWTDRPASMYKTRGNIVLNFILAPQYIYKETMIYLEADEDTTLTLVGGEWENDLYQPEWGMKGSHLALKAIFIGGRVIVQIIDNDQLADNLAALNEEDQG